LSQDEVKWLDSSEKRPWLAGLVKEKMCALLDVSALIELLNKGSDINQK
jgi:purine-binding chemotaxis protein CheW